MISFVAFPTVQMRVDRLASLGVLAGFASAKVLSGSVLVGIVLGMNIGVISAAVVNQQSQKAKDSSP